MHHTMQPAGAGLVCPDCGLTFDGRDRFVAHRAHDHPPTEPRAVSGAGGIRSQEAVHGQNPKE